jgi:hypothetical protein
MTFYVENKLWCSSLSVSMATEVTDATTWRPEECEKSFRITLPNSTLTWAQENWPCSKLIKEERNDLFSFLNHKVFLKMKKKYTLKVSSLSKYHIFWPLSAFCTRYAKRRWRKQIWPVIDWAVPSLVGFRDLGLTLGSPEDYFQTHFHSNINVNTSSGKYAPYSVTL